VELEIKFPASVSRVLVLSGPSGSGKSTIVDRLLNESPVRLREAVSATTRRPRPAEVDGKDYFFLSHEEFAAKRERGDFVECAEVHGVGDWYGTLASEISRAERESVWALLEIDVEGALAVMERYPGALTIFVLAPSMEEYRIRLESRGTETSEAISRRIATASREVQQAERYRYSVINDDLDRAVLEITTILSAWEEQSHA
jgi:guanylate kinase